jgi:hypothetical protein
MPSATGSDALPPADVAGLDAVAEPPLAEEDSAGDEAVPLGVVVVVQPATKK